MNTAQQKVAHLRKFQNTLTTILTEAITDNVKVGRELEINTHVKPDTSPVMRVSTYTGGHGKFITVSSLTNLNDDQFFLKFHTSTMQHSGAAQASFLIMKYESLADTQIINDICEFLINLPKQKPQQPETEPRGSWPHRPGYPVVEYEEITMPGREYDPEPFTGYCNQVWPTMILVAKECGLPELTLGCPCTNRSQNPFGEMLHQMFGVDEETLHDAIKGGAFSKMYNPTAGDKQQPAVAPVETPEPKAASEAKRTVVKVSDVLKATPTSKQALGRIDRAVAAKKPVVKK
jgi:hypothetical protein